MKLAKPFLDVALFTQRADRLVTFWTDQVGAIFDHVLPIDDKHLQYRMDLYGSVLKINQVTDLPRVDPSGYREVIVARNDILEVRSLRDPDGNRVCLVPTGYRGIDQIGMLIGVRDISASSRFMQRALELASAGESIFCVGHSKIILKHDDAARQNIPLIGPGWRYTTIQIFDVAREHERFLVEGGFPGMPLTRLGDVAKFAMVRDPDGNWIELSQRASLTGALDQSPAGG